MIPRRMVLLSLILSATILYAQKPGEPSPEPEPEKPIGPIVLRLVAKKTTYALDRGGMTAEAYKKAIEDGTISPLAVEFELELVNVSKTPQRIRVCGAAPKLKLDLQGKGVTTRQVSRPKDRLTVQTLEPKEKLVIPLQSLSGYNSSTTTQVFWTEPGKYTLSATFSTFLYGEPGAMPAPPVAKGKAPNPIPFPGGKGGRAVATKPITLTSKSIDLTITEKK